MATVQTRTHSESCPRCFERVRITRTEVVCLECGLVLEDSPIDHQPEWRNFDHREDKSRAMPGNKNRADDGLGSRMGNQSERDRDDERRRRLNKHARLQGHRSRNRDYTTTQIRRIGGAVGIPEPTIESGELLFRRYHRDSSEGRDLDELAPACLYAACRMAQRGRVPAELAPAARCSEHRIERVYLVVKRALGLEVPPPDVATRIRVIAGKLPVTQRDAQHACKRLRELDDARVTSGATSTVAAWLLYEECGLTQKRVCEAACVTPTAMRNRREKLT